MKDCFIFEKVNEINKFDYQCMYQLLLLHFTYMPCRLTVLYKIQKMEQTQEKTKF